MKTIRESVKDYARGSIGGFLFSLPLLYTMEVWWLGFILDPLVLMLYMLVTFFLLCGYNRFAGMHSETSVKGIISESIEEMGLGLIISFLILWLIGRIEFVNMSFLEITGKVVMESMLVAIGISVGKAQLEGNGEADDGAEHIDSRLSEAILAFCGAILIAGNIAPTEEISMIAYSIGFAGLIAVMGTALLFSFLILYFSDFIGTKKGSKNDAYIIMFDVFLSYIVAALASALMLWFFGRFHHIAFDVALARVIVLSLPASLGAAAGRLLIKK